MSEVTRKYARRFPGESKILLLLNIVYSFVTHKLKILNPYTSDKIQTNSSEYSTANSVFLHKRLERLAENMTYRLRERNLIQERKFILN